MRRIAALALIFVLLCGCVPADEPLPSTSFFAMNTPMSVQIDGDETLLRGVEDLVYSLERKLSVTDEKSEIFAINSNGGGKVSSDTAELIDFALDMCADTDGALDITIYPVVRAWGFTANDVDYEYRVLGDDEISELLALVDYRKVEISDNSVTLGEGMMLDLGAVAKGYASDRIAGYLRQNGVTSALLNLGGNVYALGKKPNGTEWTIGVADPTNGGYLGSMQVADMAVVTSGGYERFFTGSDGVRYHHIIDPSTGRPAESGLASVTVVGDSGARCDALSTALFVMGPDAAYDYWREHGGFEAVFLTADGELFVTAGLEDNFITQGEYGGTHPSVIR